MRIFMLARAIRCCISKTNYIMNFMTLKRPTLKPPPRIFFINSRLPRLLRLASNSSLQTKAIRAGGLDWAIRPTVMVRTLMLNPFIFCQSASTGLTLQHSPPLAEHSGFYVRQRPPLPWIPRGLARSLKRPHPP